MVDWFDKNDKEGKYKLSLMNNEEKCVYASYLRIIGWYYLKSSNDYQMAKEYFVKATKTFEDVKGYEELKANVISGLTNTYIIVGDIQDAQENIKILEQKLANSSDRTSIYANKARLVFIEGKYNEALDQINQSIQAAISSGLSPDALFNTGDYLLKSETLSKLGRYKEALVQIEQVYEMQKRVKEETNPIFGRIYTQKARAVFGLGVKDKALDYVNKALEIFKNNDKDFAAGKMPIVTNPTIANSLVVQGDILFSMNKLEDALNSYMKAQSVYFNLYKKNSKNVAQVSYLNLQGAKAACIKKDARMYKAFGEPQVMDFGLKNPDTIEMLKYCESYNMHLSKKKNKSDK